MRSPGDGRAPAWRVVAEWVAVLAGVALLALPLLPPAAASTAGRGAGRGTVVFDAEAGARGATPSVMRGALLRALRAAERETLVYRAATVPDDTTRALLDAARRAGVPLQLPSSGQWPRTALAVAPRPRPLGGVQIAVAVDAKGTGDTLRLTDDAGPIDAVGAGGLARWTLETTPRRLHADVRGTVAHREPRDTAGAVRRVLMVGSAGWEFRFVLEALEAAGWQVDARVPLAPTARVTIGRPAPPTRARYDVVVVLDADAPSSGPSREGATSDADAATRDVPPAGGVDARAIAAFVGDGGGLVLLGDAADAPAFAALRPAVPGARRAGVPGALRGPTPLEGLESRAVQRTAPGTIVLARSARPDSAPLLLARRVGAGRVVQALPVATWTWRMLGDDDAVGRHGAWWDALVAAAAPRIDTSAAWADAVPTAAGPAAHGLPGDAAPYADLVARLGDPAAPRVVAVPAPDAPSPPPPAWWGVVAVLLLAAAWGSRRLRGAA